MAKILDSKTQTVKMRRWSWTALIVLSTVTLLSIFTFSKLQTQYSLKQFLPLENPLLILEEKTKKTFQMAETQPFIATLQLVNPQDTWLDTEKIAVLKQTTEELSRLDGAKNSLSLATVQGAVDSKEGLTVAPLLDHIPPEKWARQVLNNSLLTPALISKDLKTASIIINYKDISQEQILTLKENIEATAQVRMPFAKIEIGGTPAVQADISQLLQSEVRNFVGLGFLACLIVLFVVFSNFTPVLISFVITVSANLIILATMALFGYSFTVLSTTIPILATVTVMSLGIHSMLRLIEEKKLAPKKPHHLHVLRTLRLLLGPNLLASITTTIGFLSLMTANVPLIRDFGLTVAMAILISWAVSSLFLAPLLILLPPPRARKWAWAKARWALHVFQKSGAWAFLIIVISVALAIKGQQLSWTARLFDDLPSDHQARNSTETIDRELGGMVPIDFELRGPVDAWNDPHLLVRLQSMLREFRGYPGVGSVVGVTDLLSSSSLTQSRLPASKASTAEMFFLFSLSDKSPLKNYLSADASQTRIAVRTQDLPSDQLDELVAGLKTRARGEFPDLKVTASGMGSVIHNLNNQLSKDLIFGFWQSMLAIFVVLIFLFRSVRWSLVACIPNLVPPAVLLGFLAISETPIKPSIAIVFSIALGLAFNNTVYLLGRLRSLQGNSALKKIDIEKALWLEGNPCLISSLTLLAGFSVFMISYFAMNRIFGFYMVLSMLAGLVGDLILLPTLLKSCPWLLSPAKKLKGNLMIQTSVIALMLFATTSSHPVQAAVPPLTVEKIGQEIRTRLNSKDESFTVKMKVIEADSSVKERDMKITRMSPGKKEHYILVRMQQPKDLKGTSLLATFKDGKEERWLYLPSSKTTRRLATNSESSSILGSELSTEDFNINSEQATKSTLKPESAKDPKTYVVESDVNQASSTYSKVVSSIAADTYLPIQSECFDKDGKLLKTIQFSDYKKVGDNKWRATEIHIRNVQTQRGTDIVLSDIKVDQNLKTTAFTPKALSED